MTVGLIKGGHLPIVIMHIIWTYQKTESFVNRSLRAHSIFVISGFLAFVGALNVISSVLSICYLTPQFDSHLYFCGIRPALRPCLPSSLGCPTWCTPRPHCSSCSLQHGGGVTINLRKGKHHVHIVHLVPCNMEGLLQYIWEKEVSRSIACMGKKAALVYWSCLLIVMKDATPSTPRCIRA